MADISRAVSDAVTTAENYVVGFPPVLTNASIATSDTAATSESVSVKLAVSVSASATVATSEGTGATAPMALLRRSGTHVVRMNPTLLGAHTLLGPNTQLGTSPDVGNPVRLRGTSLAAWFLIEGWEYGGNSATEVIVGRGAEHRDILTGLTTLTGDAAAVATWRTNVLNAYTTEADIAQLKKIGLNHVRVPLNHWHFDNYATAGPSSVAVDLTADGWAALDNMFDWCDRHGVYVILDMHGAPGGQQRGFDSDPDSTLGNFPLWTSGSAANLQAFTATLWGALANRYGARSSLLGYDVLNEPESPSDADLIALYQASTAAIRAHDSTHIVFLEGNSFAKDFTWTTITAPTAIDSNVVLSAHYYKFNSGTSQGTVDAFARTARGLGVPLWIGEMGQDSVLNVATQIDWTEPWDVICGWAFWLWKKDDTTAGLLKFAPGAGWASVIAYLDNHTSPPDGPTTTAAMASLLAAVDNAACTYDASMGAVMLTYQRHSYEDGTYQYWRLNEDPGSTVLADSGGYNSAANIPLSVPGSGVTLGGAGLAGTLDTVATYDGTAALTEQSATTVSMPTNNFALKVWIRTTLGGVAFQWANSQTGLTPSSYQPGIWVGTSGKVNFGVFASANRVVQSSMTVNDGNWHFVVGVMGDGGTGKNLTIYVDGQLAGTTANTNSMGVYSGYARVGWGRLVGTTYSDPPSLNYWRGDLSEVGWYKGNVLTAAQIQQLYSLGAGFPSSAVQAAETVASTELNISAGATRISVADSTTTSEGPAVTPLALATTRSDSTTTSEAVAPATSDPSVRASDAFGTISEGVGRTLSVSVSLGDASTTSDSSLVTETLVVAAGDSTSTSEGRALAVSTPAAVVHDSPSTAEGVAAGIGQTFAVRDSTTTSEGVSAAPSPPASTSDAAALSEAVALTLTPLFVRAGDAVVYDDTTVVVQPQPGESDVSVRENVFTVDAQATRPSDPTLVMLERTLVTDTPFYAPSSDLHVSEATTAAEHVALLPFTSLSVGDAAAVTEVARTAASVKAVSHETVTTSDVGSVQQVSPLAVAVSTPVATHEGIGAHQVSPVFAATHEQVAAREAIALHQISPIFLSTSVVVASAEGVRRNLSVSVSVHDVASPIDSPAAASVLGLRVGERAAVAAVPAVGETSRIVVADALAATESAGARPLYAFEVWTSDQTRATDGVRLRTFHRRRFSGGDVAPHYDVSYS